MSMESLELTSPPSGALQNVAGRCVWAASHAKQTLQQVSEGLQGAPSFQGVLAHCLQSNGSVLRAAQFANWCQMHPNAVVLTALIIPLKHVPKRLGLF